MSAVNHLKSRTIEQVVKLSNLGKGIHDVSKIHEKMFRENSTHLPKMINCLYTQCCKYDHQYDKRVVSSLLLWLLQCMMMKGLKTGR